MTMRTAHLTVAAITATVLAGCKPRAADTYALASREHRFPAGTTVEVHRRLSVDNIPMSVLANGLEVKGSMTTTTEEELSAEFRESDHLRITVKTSREESEVVMNGTPVPKPPEINPLEGLTLAVRRAAGTWTPQLESGAPLTPAQRAKASAIIDTLLTRESDAKLFGSHARQAGEEWTTDAASFSSLSAREEQPTGHITFRFARVEEHRGFRCAVLTGDLEMTLRPKSESGGATMVLMAGQITIHRSLEHHLNLAIELNGEMVVSGTPQPDVTINAQGPFRLLETVDLTLP